MASKVWETADQRITPAGATPQQVQAIWLKQAEATPAQLGEFPKHAQVLTENEITILNLAQQRYPNLRIAYLSSRIYGGYAGTNMLNPEPYAYEGAFAVRDVILGPDQRRSPSQRRPRQGSGQSPRGFVGTLSLGRRHEGPRRRRSCMDGTKTSPPTAPIPPWPDGKKSR